MYSARLPVVIEDAYNNKYYFGYANSSIICKEISYYGNIKETMLVNQVSEAFLVALDKDNVIYLACHSKNKGIILFTYADKSWLMEEIVYINPTISVCLLDMFIIGKTIHILYATSLPLLNYYNVYHLHDMSGSFKKSSISEIYSEDLERSFCAALIKDSLMSFIGIWNDGRSNILNYYHYDFEADTWTSSKVAVLSNSNIRVDLLVHGTRFHLLCHAFEDNLTILFYFTKKALDTDSFEFISMSKFELDERDQKPVFYFHEDQLYAEWLNEKALYRMQFTAETRNWSEQIIIPFDSPPIAVKHLKTTSSGIISGLRYAYIDGNMNINTVEYEMKPVEEDDQSEIQSEPLKIQSMDELIPYLVKQISTLTEDIKTIQTKLNQKPEKMENIQEVHTSANEVRENASAKGGYTQNSKFRENFMNNRMTTSTANRKPNDNRNQKRQPPKKSSNFKEKFINGEVTYGGTTGTSIYQGSSNNSNQAVGVSRPQVTKKAFDKKENNIKMTMEKENGNMFVSKDNRFQNGDTVQPLTNYAGNNIKDTGMPTEIAESMLSEAIPASLDNKMEISGNKTDTVSEKKASYGLLKKLGDFLKQNM